VAYRDAKAEALAYLRSKGKSKNRSRSLRDDKQSATTKATVMATHDTTVTLYG
jgi:hypothetical protein